MASASPEIRVGDRTFVIETLAADLAAAAGNAVGRGRRFVVAIPGGSVASTCFPRLARLDLDWTMVEFFWVDERAVAPTSPDSNYAMARSLWLDPARVPADRIHRMRAEQAELRRAAAEYSSELAGVCGTPPELDYVVLGVGPDGHVASLFPGRPTSEEGRWALAVEDAPKPPPRRLTLSLPALTGARRVAIVATGEEKAPVIRAALEQGSSSLPVVRVARGARSCAFLLDRAAASLMEQRS